MRQPQIRYSAPLSKQVTLHVAVEEPESGTATAGAPTVIENGDDKLPDFAARLAWSGKFAEASFAGLVRQLRVENAGVSATSTGWGVSAAGKLFLNTAKSADLRAMVTYGHGIGRYVGLNFAPDAVFNPATNSLERASEFAALAALRVPLAPQVRVNLIGSYQSVDYSSDLSLASIGAFNKRAWSLAGNVFYSPVKNVDVGLEYRHAERDLVSGADGTLDRVEFAAKYSF